MRMIAAGTNVGSLAEWVSAGATVVAVLAGFLSFLLALRQRAREQARRVIFRATVTWIPDEDLIAALETMTPPDRPWDAAFEEEEGFWEVRPDEIAPGGNPLARLTVSIENTSDMPIFTPYLEWYWGEIEPVKGRLLRWWSMLDNWGPTETPFAKSEDGDAIQRLAPGDGPRVLNVPVRTRGYHAMVYFLDAHQRAWCYDPRRRRLRRTRRRPRVDAK